MKNLKKLLTNKFFYIVLIFLVICTLFIHLALNFLFLPKEINIIAGSIHKLNFNIPAIATIIPKNKKHININNNPISEATNINLNKPVYIESNDIGTHNMTLSVLGIPIKNVKLSVLPYTEIIPSGSPVGVQINTDGVMVLGLSSFKTADKREFEPTKGLLKSGDMILNINDKYIDSKETLMQIIENEDTLNMEILRKSVKMDVTIIPTKGEDGKNKIGAWVRDSTQGVGTLTYINPVSKSFGALGHGIVDVDTNEIMTVKNGKIFNSEVRGIKKGEKGTPGELLGSIKIDEPIGDIKNNTPVGIYGKITNDNLIDKSKALPIGLRNEVKIAPATILCSIDGKEPREYDISIESINKYNIDDSKSMIINITDEELLSQTGGIVQGMSGSPIIQDNKIIGAITHVFINNPTKGYGIFIENMIQAEDNIE